MWPCTLRLGMAKEGGFVWPSTVARAAKAGEWDSLEELTAGLLVVHWQKGESGGVQADGKAGAWVVEEDATNPTHIWKVQNNCTAPMFLLRFITKLQ